MNARLLTPAEICPRIGVSRATFYRIVTQDPTFPAAVRVRHRPRWREDQVDAWMESRLGARSSVSASA